MSSLCKFSVWEIVKPAFAGEYCKGRSIAKSSVWGELNVWPEGSRHHTALDLEEITDILLTLSAYGILWAQFAGSCWEITIKPEYRAQTCD